MSIAIIAMVTLSAMIVWYFILKKKNQHIREPPGPRPYPIIGNMADLTGSDLYQSLTKLSKKYGDIYQLTLIDGAKAIVINSGKLAREACLSKKDDFSGRPYTFIGDYFTRGSQDIICADFTPTMVSLRKTVHSAFKMYGQAFHRLESNICSEADDLAQRLIEHKETPFDPKADLNVSVLNVVCAVINGKRYDKNDEEFKRIIEYIDDISSIFGSYNILDFFPFLRYLPLPSVKLLNKAKASRDDNINKRYHDHKERYLEDNANNNFEIKDLTDALLKSFDDNTQGDRKGACAVLTEDNLMMTMNDVYNAGVETTASFLTWLLVYMVNYPEIQEKVHKELDVVIGNGRLPRLNDRENLPYTRAVIAETLRIISHVPLSLPHKTTRDTSLAGYDIPKDRLVILNLYAIHHNPNEWKDPDVYDPQRFLDDQGVFCSSNKDYLPFGAGRRHCIGESLAKSEVFLLSSRLLHQFLFTNPPGEPLPSLKGKAGVVLQPMSFKVIAKERV